MLKSDWGTSVSEWSTSSKTAFKNDLAKLASVPVEVLRSLSARLAETYPACNIAEVSLAESERSGKLDGPSLVDIASVLAFMFDKADGDDPASVAADLVSLEMLPKTLEPTVASLLEVAQPLRKSANAASANIRFGAALFVGLRGTIDIRLRFNESEDEIKVGAEPLGLFGAQRLIFANLSINRPNNKEDVIGFVMDEADLQCMKRFVKNMEAALEISKKLDVGRETNG